MFMYGGRGWNRKSQKKGGEVVVEWNLCQCPKHHHHHHHHQHRLYRHPAIITTIATRITAAEPTFFGWYLRRVLYWGN
jgi:hypothetical protein